MLSVTGLNIDTHYSLALSSVFNRQFYLVVTPQPFESIGPRISHCHFRSTSSPFALSFWQFIFIKQTRPPFKLWTPNAAKRPNWKCGRGWNRLNKCKDGTLETLLFIRKRPFHYRYFFTPINSAYIDWSFVGQLTLVPVYLGRIVDRCFIMDFATSCARRLATP